MNNRKQLSELIANSPKSMARTAYVSKKYQNLYESVVDETSFLDDDVYLFHRYEYFLKNILEPYECPVCSKKLVNREHYHKSSLLVFCSKDCRLSAKGVALTIDKQQQTIMNRYGVLNVMYDDSVRLKHKEQCDARTYDERNMKLRNTCIERYGVDNFSKTDEFKEMSKSFNLNYNAIVNKSKQTSVERYGVDHYAKTKEGKEKFAETLLSKYGVSNPSHISDVHEKRRTTRYNKWLLHPIDDLNEIIELYNKYRNAAIVGEIAGIHYQSILDLLRRNGIEPKRLKRKSSAETQIMDFLIHHNINVESNKSDFTFTKKELDLYLTDFNIGIEYNGLYWHSSGCMEDYTTYHKSKSDLFRNNGIRVIHIWEDEWIHQKDDVERYLLNILGLSLVETNVDVVCDDVDGSMTYSIFHDGLFVDNVNVQDNTHSYEICSLKWSNNVFNNDAMCKIIDDLNGKCPEKQIVAHVDLDKFDKYNNVYVRNGFILESVEDVHWCVDRTKKLRFPIGERTMLGMFEIYGCGTARMVKG